MAPKRWLTSFLPYIVRKPIAVRSADNAASDISSAEPPVGTSLGSTGFVSVAPPDTGKGLPPDGISPAKADDERTHAKTTDIRNRFKCFLL
jgi:hypothetical protein